MRRKARPIWWLMILGVVTTLAASAWVYFHQASTMEVVDRAKALLSKETPSPLLLKDAREECRIVADYAHAKGLREVYPILERGTFVKIGDVSTEGVGSLDCSAAFQKMSVATTKALKTAGHEHAIVFSRVYVTGPKKQDAFFTASDHCPLCGKGEHIDVQLVSGKWIVVGETEDRVS